MKVTRDTLKGLAKREAEHRAEVGDVISGYLIGSVANGEPLIGGAADIDLVLIHERPPASKREIVQLSETVHLDISHHSKDFYAQPRELRVHPWIGPSLCEPVFLFDPEHFFEQAQAGARGQFHRPDHIHTRAKAFLDRARQMAAFLPLTDRWLKTYCQALLEGANAVVSLVRFPIAGRRLALELAEVAETMGHPELYGSFLQLLGSESFNEWHLPEWHSAWGRAFDQASQESTNPELVPCRRDYYFLAFQALAEAGYPKASLWSLLTTWEKAIQELDGAGGTESLNAKWNEFLEQMKLSSPFAEVNQLRLEKYFNLAEDLISLWAERTGA